MDVKNAFITAVCLTSVLLTVYVCTQPSLTHLTLAIAKFSPRKQSVCYELPTQNNFNYQDGEGDSAIISTTSVIDNHTWQDALHQFQLAVEQVRDNFINEFMSQIGKCFSCNNKTTVFDEFLNVKHRLALKNLSKVNILVGSIDVGWFGGNAANESVVANLPAQRMFKPFGTQPVCDDFPNKIWQQIISCNSSDINQHAATTSTAITNSENEVLRRSLLLNYSPESLYSYVNLFANVSINDLGSIKAYDGCLTVLPIACRPGGVRRDKFVYNERNRRMHIVDEVFTIAQYWGSEYFHATIENLPRLAPYVEFLQRRPHIRLHVALNSRINKRTSEHVTASLAALGIDPKRLVSGHIRAKIAYVPRGTPCGNGLMPELQILSWRFHNYIANSLNETEHSSIVLIIRKSKYKRNIARSTYKLIKKHLRTVTKDGPLKLELFDDRHRLRHSDTLRMFYRARIVIGIHGAGLANMIYSRPGTQVIEMLCQPPDQVNLCYASTALKLGHRYHAFPVNHCTGNPTIDIGTFLTVLDTYVGAETVQAGVHSR